LLKTNIISQIASWLRFVDGFTLLTLMGHNISVVNTAGLKTSTCGLHVLEQWFPNWGKTTAWGNMRFSEV